VTSVKFHKVVRRRYSGEVLNIYMIFQRIYSGNYIPNFIRIPGFCRKYYKNHFGLFFWTHCMYMVRWCRIINDSVVTLQDLDEIVINYPSMFEL